MAHKIRVSVVSVLSVLALAVGGVFFAAIPASASVSGTIYCDDGSNIVGVWVDSSNNAHDGWASFYNTGGGNATYTYAAVSGESHRFNVGCGGTPQSWAHSIYSPWTTSGYADLQCHVSFVANQESCSF